MVTGEGGKSVVITGEDCKSAVVTEKGCKSALVTEEDCKSAVVTGEGDKSAVVSGEGCKSAVVTGEYKSAMLLLSYSQPVPGLWVTSSLRLPPLSSMLELNGRISPRDPGAQMTSSRQH